MEFCVATNTGRIISVRTDGAAWGTGESYTRFIEQEEPARWHGRLMVIKVPELSDLYGYRFHRGLISLDWFTDNAALESTLSEVDFLKIAIPAIELDAD